MVQHAAHPPYHEAYNVHRDYWKLPNYDDLSYTSLVMALDRYGYDFPDAPPKARLRHLLCRAEGNLIAYPHIDREELAGFCVTRMLDFGRDADVDSLSIILEQADQEATFERFADLPPELRLQIYSLHYESLGDGFDATVQPPITRVSRSLRKEALPLFYQSRTFGIKIGDFEDECAKSKPQQGGSSAEYHDTNLSKKAKAFWAQLPDQYLAMVTRLRLLDVQQDDDPPPYLICLGVGEHSRPVATIEKDLWGGYDRVEYKGQEKALQRLLDQMAARPEGKQLQRSDIEQFIRRFDVDGWQGYDDGDDFHLFTDEEIQST